MNRGSEDGSWDLNEPVWVGMGYQNESTHWFTWLFQSTFLKSKIVSVFLGGSYQTNLCINVQVPDVFSFNKLGKKKIKKKVGEMSVFTAELSEIGQAGVWKRTLAMLPSRYCVDFGSKWHLHHNMAALLSLFGFVVQLYLLQSLAAEIVAWWLSFFCCRLQYHTQHGSQHRFGTQTKPNIAPYKQPNTHPQKPICTPHTCQQSHQHRGQAGRACESA